MGESMDLSEWVSLTFSLVRESRLIGTGKAEECQYWGESLGVVAVEITLV